MPGLLIKQFFWAVLVVAVLVLALVIATAAVFAGAPQNSALMAPRAQNPEAGAIDAGDTAGHRWNVQGIFK